MTAVASARRHKRSATRRTSTNEMSHQIGNYADAMDWLKDHYNLEQHLGGNELTVPSLDRMRTLMALLGDPQHDVPAIHITGTNGKGSTSRMVVELIGATGLDVGSYTSPHIDRVNDRIMIANKPLDDDSMTQALAEVAEVEPWVLESTGETPSYFEILCAAAYNWFAATAVDVNVIEVGMGGRWDATNIIEAEVVALTNIGRDHLEIIGPTIADATHEKAGIISPRSHVICGETRPELLDIVSATQHRELWCGRSDYDVIGDRLAVGGRVVDLVTPYGRHEDIFLPVNGAHQSQNAATAVAAVEAFFGRQLDDDVVSEAFARLELPARFEVMQRQPLVIVDGAHNPPAAVVAAETLFDDFSNAQAPILVMGTNRPHDPVEFVDALRGTEFSVIIATAADWPRAIAAETLGIALKNCGPRIETVPRVADALDRAIELAGESGTVLVTGSLYVASEARSQLRNT
jgi:dihydrofolate synthase/folylpolyglutamate synthase